MAFTSDQKTAIKGAIASTSAMQTALSGPDPFPIIAALFNTPASGSVWRTEVPTQVLVNAINFDLYIPADDLLAVVTDLTGLLGIKVDAQIAQAMRIQLQMSALLQLLRRDALDMSMVGIRTSLLAATTNVPSGATNAKRNPGGASGATVLAAGVRVPTVLEKLLWGASATTGAQTANLLIFEGQITGQQVSDIYRNV